MRNDELNNIEAIIFDIDGVLIDVKQSYRMAIEKTIQYFVKKESSVIQSDIEMLKRHLALITTGMSHIPL